VFRKTIRLFRTMTAVAIANYCVSTEVLCMATTSWSLQAGTLTFTRTFTWFFASRYSYLTRLMAPARWYLTITCTRFSAKMYSCHHSPLGSLLEGTLPSLGPGSLLECTLTITRTRFSARMYSYHHSYQVLC
jgi:hypothetical protein